MRRKISILMASLLVITGLTGCGKEKETETKLQGAPENEIITTTPVDQNKTMITVRVEFGAGQRDNLEKSLEEKFPDVDIVLRHDGALSSSYTIKANLEAGVECDLILSRNLPVVSEIADEYLLDISSQNFVDNYYMNSVDSCATQDGKLYYLPGPSDVYGIVYDKTMFEENGWEVPHSYTEFVNLLDTIRTASEADGSNVTPLQVSMMYPDMFQIFFNTYGFEDAYAGSENYKWLLSYQDGEGSMTGHMEQAVSDFKKLFDDGILSLDDLDVTPSRRSEMMYTEHSAAMIIECQNAVDYARTYSQNTGEDDQAHEIGMMPFWISDQPDGDYLYAIPSYYMAINKTSAEESEEKKELLLEIYSYLSSVEGQEMLMGDDFQLSNISGVSMKNNDFSSEIIDTIERGQIINNFYFAAGETNKQVERQMLTTVKSMLQGEISVEDWLLAADETRDSFLSGEMSKETSYGTVTTTLTRLETAYTMAEMYRDVMDVQIGIAFGGECNKSTNGYLYKGDITDSSLECIRPDKEAAADSEDSDSDKIVTAKLTGQQIMDVLNSSAGLSNTKGTYPYYVAAGLKVEFNPWAEEGKRVISCKLANGEELDLDATYEVAFFNGSLPELEVETERVLDQTWKETFLQWLEKCGGTIGKPEMTLTLKYES